MKDINSQSPVVFSILALKSLGDCATVSLIVQVNLQRQISLDQNRFIVTQDFHINSKFVDFVNFLFRRTLKNGFMLAYS